MTNDTPYAPVWRADVADRQAVSGILTEAFMDDPVACWLFPASGERRRLQSHFYGHLLDRGTAEAYLVGRGEGASVWLALAAGQAPEEEPPDAPDVDQKSIFGENGARLRTLGQALAERHPRREPHLYLSCMGVVGGRQGAGLGSAMLRHRLERADADGIAAYLEASSPRSRALYLRYGFEDLGEPVRVADSPLLWPMWRQPRRRPSHQLHHHKGEPR
ncbi:GNAT family N-acetyltransferase [Micromonospora sp. NBC_01796]|uniref:GNAT family N-acetyltransferase n=1 Tax=Micromonospora sp. NBC_01796 TaxID=2975987 RepID=UPI002DDB2998|nr:GNAT family N-acetyltransferase [Micromonospora sp. NBC_01796]WSA84789.1 GNAT family N-acetyltransferase [Micromonospora sp. NBC_01796]